MDILLKEYIENIQLSKNDDENIIQINKFINYIKNINITDDICVELMSYENINELIEIIINNNIKITNKNINKLIKHYCHNLEYETKEIFETTNEIDGYEQYIKEIKQYKLLTSAETKELCKKIKENNDEKDKEKLINSNLRLVVYIANKFVNRGIGIKDLIQEGNIGLIKAADTYDCEKGFEFSTYAACCIKNSIRVCIRNTNRNIRIPSYMIDKLNNYCKQKKELEKEFGRNLTITELSECLSMTIGEINQYEQLLNDTISLNTIDTDNEKKELEDYIASDEESIENQIDKKELKELLEQIMKKILTPREISVLNKRFGLENEKQYTLRELGEMYSVSGERIRSIQEKALKKLRKCNEIEDLLIYLENPNTKNKKIKKYNTDISTINEKYIFSDEYKEILRFKKENLLKFKKEEILKKEQEEITRIYQNKTENKEENKNKKIKTSIYRLLNMYTKKQVDNAIEKLSDRDKKIIKIKYDDNQYYSDEYNSEISYYFYHTVLKNLKQNLINEKISYDKRIEIYQKIDNLILLTRYSKYVNVLSYKEKISILLKLNMIDEIYISKEEINEIINNIEKETKNKQRKK